MASKDFNRKKLVYGIGINDADYTVQPIINGKSIVCPYYIKWKNMLTRCYSTKYQARNTTYIDCTVCDEWLSFMTFRSWMVEQDWKDKELDKDILTTDSKIYSPETCLFVSHAINTLLNEHAAARGYYPQGVYLNRTRQKYHAAINKYGKSCHLGYFATVSEAASAYIKAKAQHIYEVALSQNDDRIYGALIRRSYSLIGCAPHEY